MVTRSTGWVAGAERGPRRAVGQRGPAARRWRRPRPARRARAPCLRHREAAARPAGPRRALPCLRAPRRGAVSLRPHRTRWHLPHSARAVSTSPRTRAAPPTRWSGVRIMMGLLAAAPQRRRGGTARGTTTRGSATAAPTLGRRSNPARPASSSSNRLLERPAASGIPPRAKARVAAGGLRSEGAGGD